MKRSLPEDSPYHLDHAQIEWHADATPEAKNYGDIYFQKQAGLKESEYVFLEQNNLAVRFEELSQKKFIIAETGFGTGLNFLTTWRLWQRKAPKDARLHFISTEKHPLIKTDLIKALAAWPELQTHANALLESYPPLLKGQHCLRFDNGKVVLQLLLGDAIESLEQLRSSNHPHHLNHSEHKVDAWFLDGFAPAKNPTLWNTELYQLMAQLSQPGSTVATFTAVGDVRRGLTSFGFLMEKVKGYGSKREMLRGEFKQHQTEVSPLHPKGIKAPWYIANTQTINSQPKKNKTAVIIGGGLAGTSTAYALAQSNWQVTLIEREQTLAPGASGNPQGMLYTKLSADAGKLNQFSLSSYLYAQRFYRELYAKAMLTDESINFCGLLQLCTSDKEKSHLQHLATFFKQHPDLVQFVNTAEASKIADLPIEYDGYYLPQSGWIAPPKLCHALCLHENISVKTHTEALGLANNNQWTISGKNFSTIQADVVVIANSFDALQFSQTEELPLKTIRGQITQLDSTQTQEYFKHSPKTVICHTGYITPPINGALNIGATFGINDNDPSIRSSDHQFNIDNLLTALPALKTSNTININALTGRTAFRCVAPDYLPLVGRVPIREDFLADFSPLAKNAKKTINTLGSYYPNLYVNLAHGSKGLSSSPLCAELLAAQINSEPPPLPRELINALNPARFLIRDIIRNRIKSGAQ